MVVDDRVSLATAEVMEKSTGKYHIAFVMRRDQDVAGCMMCRPWEVLKFALHAGRLGIYGLLFKR